MSTPFLGEIMLVAFSIGGPPRGYAFCDGALLAASQMPAHTHFPAAGGAQTTSHPVGNVAANGGAYASAAATQLGQTVAVGANQPHPNMQPFLVLSFVIALQGIFPSRN